MVSDKTPENDKLRSEQTAEKLIELIRNRSFKPGDKLPNELELSRELGVARSTVRESVKQLISRNVLYIKRGVGTFVSEMPGLVEDPWGLEFLLTDIEIASQLIELRLIIEPEMARLAALRATEEEIARIRKCCIRTEDRIFAGEPHDREDMLFHLAVSNASHNQAASAILRQVFSQSIPMQSTLSKNALLKETIETHSRVTDSIERHDAEAAFRNMKDHLEYNREIIARLQEET